MTFRTLKVTAIAANKIGRITSLSLAVLGGLKMGHVT